MSAIGPKSPIVAVLCALELAGCAPRRSGVRWQARCPAHDDRRPSLAIALGRDGRVLIQCWSGCATGQVLEALGLGWSDLFAGASGLRR